MQKEGNKNVTNHATISNKIEGDRVIVMVFNATFNIISVIS
jgi:hypothetical protein